MKTEAGAFLALRQVLYHLYNEILDKVLKRYGMTQMELNILLFLANNPQYDTAAEMVSICKLAKSQVSAAVENLASRGYLRRELEGRRIHLYLEPAAEPVIADGRQCRKTFSDVVLGGISQEEREVLNHMLMRMEQNARAAEKKLNEGKEL